MPERLELILISKILTSVSMGPSVLLISDCAFIHHTLIVIYINLRMTGKLYR